MRALLVRTVIDLTTVFAATCQPHIMRFLTAQPALGEDHPEDATVRMENPVGLGASGLTLDCPGLPRLYGGWSRFTS
jgi:hypothetical protein